MIQSTQTKRPSIKNVSYGDQEVEIIQSMEEFLMNKKGMNFSQLHKSLIRKEYSSDTLSLI